VVEWHETTLASLSPDTWENHKYLILYCPRIGGCAGASDRLQPVPLYLRLAHLTNRLFFIHWEHPYPLEEFLIPARIRWSMPDWLLNATQPLDRLPRLYDSNNISEYENHTAITVAMKLGSAGTVTRYDSQEGDGEFERVCREVFHLLFELSPPVAKMLQERMQSAGLIQDKYAVAHSRVLYTSNERNMTNLPTNDTVRKEVSNAIHCASKLMPGSPIYYASDSAQAKQQAQEYAAENNYSVVVFTDLKPIHLDFATQQQVEDYYPIFVDLYIMSYGKCIAYGVGGYGMWANLMSKNVSCFSKHHEQTCKWTKDQ